MVQLLEWCSALVADDTYRTTISGLGAEDTWFDGNRRQRFQPADVIPYLDMQFSLHSTDDEERSWLFGGHMGTTMLSIPQIAEYVERLESAADQGGQERLLEGPMPSGDSIAAELERFLREQEEP